VLRYATVLAAITLAAAPAGAQDGSNIQAFSPAPGQDDFIVNYGARVPKHKSWTAGLLLDFAEDPLVVVDAGGEETSKIVDSAWTLHLMGAVALWDRLEAGLVAPFSIQNGAGDADGSTFGDIRLVPKLHVFWFGEQDGGVGLAFVPEVTFPTGDEKALSGDPNVSFAPRVAVEAQKQGWGGVLNLGYRLREGFAASNSNLGIDDELLLSAGLRAPIGLGLTALADLYTHIGTQARGDLDQVEVPTEVAGGVRYVVPAPRIALLAGLGTGLTQGYGTAQVRFFIGAAFQERVEEPEIVPTAPPEEIAPPPPPPPEEPPPPPPEPEPMPEPPPPPPPPPPPAKARIVADRVEIDDKVQFEIGKAVLLPESQSLLDDVAAVLVQHAEVKYLEVAGHTDSTGKAAKNRKLSQDRAEAVRLYLIDKGVAAERLTAKGYGPDKPIADNKTKEGRDKNRRVEFLILKADPVVIEQDVPPPAPPTP
jgi:OOP family OmpA-OmpF porin